MIRIGEPDHITEQYLEHYPEGLAHAIGFVDKQEDQMALSCKYMEKNEHGVLVERCLRDATLMVDGKSYCPTHVIYVGIEKEQQEEQLRIDNQPLDIDDMAIEVDAAFKWMLTTNRHNRHPLTGGVHPNGRPSPKCIEAAESSYREALVKQHYQAVDDLRAKKKAEGKGRRI